MTYSPTPRFDRIISLVMIVMLGLAVVFLVEVSPNILRLYLGGDLPVITVSWLLIASLVVVAAAGADIMARSHPEMQLRDLPTINLGVARIELVPSFWVLPAFTVMVCFAFFRLFAASLPGGAFVLALVLTGALLVGTLIGQHYGCDRNPRLRGQALFLLQAIGYLLAFGCFSAIYYARLRTIYSATLIGVSATLLAWALLHWARQPSLPLAAVVGLVLAEATWALNYWAAPFLVGGALLLVLFYTLVGTLQHHLAGTLNRRVVAEFGLLGAALFTMVVYVTYLT
jgi:hypothetical protein